MSSTSWQDSTASFDQEQQLQKIAALEKASLERLDKINLLQARVDALEQDNSVLQEKSHKLQKKTKALAKEKKGNHFSLELVVVVVFL